MSGSADRHVPGKALDRWDRAAELSHRLVLPAASVTCILLGAVVGAVTPNPLGFASFVGFVAVGVAISFSSIAVARSRDRSPSNPETPQVLPVPRAPPPSPPPLDRRPDLNHRFLPVHSTVHTGRIRSGGPVTTVLASPAEELWTEWKAVGPGRLPGDLVGPVPATAYGPDPPGRPSPFPHHDHFERVEGTHWADPSPPSDRRSSTSGGWRSVPSDAPNLGPTSLVPPPSRRVTASHGAVTGPAPGSVNLDVSGGVLGTHWLWAEALNPMPPHLRADDGDRPSRSEPESASGSTSSPPGPGCPNCGRSMLPPPEGRACPNCQGPVCPRCSVLAAVTYGDTWCGSCGLVPGTPSTPESDDPYDGLARLAPDYTPVLLPRPRPGEGFGPRTSASVPPPEGLGAPGLGRVPAPGPVGGRADRPPQWMRRALAER
jgi:hypothetical protein